MCKLGTNNVCSTMLACTLHDLLGLRREPEEHALMHGSVSYSFSLCGLGVATALLLSGLLHVSEVHGPTGAILLIMK